jgi:DNA-binding MarR family transcriptional regulator
VPAANRVLVAARQPSLRRKQATAGDPRIAWLIWEAFQHTRRSIEVAVKRHGITATQLGVLNRLAEQPGLSGVELARILMVTPQAAHVALQTLATKGLVERKPGAEGGRVVRSGLTEEGRRVVRSCLAERGRVEKHLVAGLTPADRATLASLLERYITGLEGDDD